MSNAAKAEALAKHLLDGGDLEVNTLAEIIGVSNRSIKTIEKYLREVGEEHESLQGLEIGGTSPYYRGEEDGDAEEEASDEEIEGEDEDPDEDEEEEEEPAPAPKPKLKKSKGKGKGKSKPPYRFFLQGEGGVDTELEQVDQTGKVVTFRVKEETDIVKVMLKGEVVEVDIVQLRKQIPDGDSGYGVSNDFLLGMAVAARPD